MGTADYIAPEQAQDAHQADVRADIYSLGCSLYHLLVGKPPVAGGTVVQKIAAHLSGTAAKAKLPASVPPELRTVLTKMVAKDAVQRYQTPAEVAVALARFIKKPTGVKPPSVPGPAVENGPDRTIVEKVDGQETLPPAPENEAKALAKARRLAKKPAMAMLVMGILGLLPSLFMACTGAILWILRLLPDFLSKTEFDNTRYLGPIYLFVFSPLAAAAGMAIKAALNMKKLRSYRLCVWGSYTVMPAGLVLILLGVPVGIWSLKTLRIPGMRSAFELNEEQERAVGESIDALNRE